MSKISQRKFKRKVHINNQEWTYKINYSPSKKMTYLKFLNPTGDKQYSLALKNIGTDREWCCDLRCYVKSMTYFNPLTPSIVKDLIVKKVGII